MGENLKARASGFPGKTSGYVHTSQKFHISHHILKKMDNRFKNYYLQPGVIHFPKQKEWWKEVESKYQVLILETVRKTNEGSIWGRGIGRAALRETTRWAKLAYIPPHLSSTLLSSLESSLPYSSSLSSFIPYNQNTSVPYPMPSGFKLFWKLVHAKPLKTYSSFSSHESSLP